MSRTFFCKGGNLLCGIVPKPLVAARCLILPDCLGPLGFEASAPGRFLVPPPCNRPQDDMHPHDPPQGTGSPLHAKSHLPLNPLKLLFRQTGHRNEVGHVRPLQT
jgi:hypothetical protein